MIITLTEAQQLTLARQICEQHLSFAQELQRVIQAHVANNFAPIPAQNIKQTAESCASAIQVLDQVLKGKLVFN